MFMSLTATCIVAGAVLAAVYGLTKDAIEASKKAKLEDAIREVVPPYDNTPAAEAYLSAVSAGDSLKIYPARKDNRLVGVAVESYSKNGFSGEIKVIAGLDASGKVINYKVLGHSETPGLGSRMEEWFRTDKNRQSILGKNLSQGMLKVTKDGGEVDAITAATISSRAFLDALNRAYIAFSGKAGYTDAVSSATTSQTEEAVADADADSAVATLQKPKAVSPAAVENRPVAADSIYRHSADSSKTTVLQHTPDKLPTAPDSTTRRPRVTKQIPEQIPESSKHLHLETETIPPAVKTEKDVEPLKDTSPAAIENNSATDTSKTTKETSNGKN
jgi:electron transport complex protein RnfG